MHPVISLVSLVIFSLCIAMGTWAQGLLGAFLLFLLLLRSSAGAWSVIIPMMRRMRWLWMSLVVVYFWFTPGRPIFPIDSALVPTVEGINLGALRITALSLIVTATGLFLHITTREQLFAALHWLAAPLAYVGVARERLAARMALSLAAVAEVQTLVQDVALRDDSIRTPWARWGHTAAATFRAVLVKAETVPCIELALPPRYAPPFWQWAVPAAVAAAMSTVGALI